MMPFDIGIMFFVSFSPSLVKYGCNGLIIFLNTGRHDEVSKYLCGRGATLVLDEFEAGVRMCQVGPTLTAFR